MPVPPFDIHGVIPPFTGPTPIDQSARSPFAVTPTDVVSSLGSTADRLQLLQNWLTHRSSLRALGIVGFQWLDGSFVENKTPADIDVVTFLRRPTALRSDVAWQAFVRQNISLFAQPMVKAALRLDAYFVELDGTPETIVNTTSYWFGLFTHRRPDFMWKGILKVDLEADPMADHLALVELLIANAASAGP